MEQNERKLMTPSELGATAREFTAGTLLAAHSAREHHTPEADMLMDMILMDSLSERCCVAPQGWCPDKDSLDQNKMPYSVQYLADNLPAVQFVSQFYLEMIIHGGIKAKDESNQKKLDDWMLKENPMGESNGNVLREALHQSIIYGYCGLRIIDKDITLVPANHFKIWRLPATMPDPKTGKERPIPGIQAPILYEVNMAHDLGLEIKEETKEVFELDEQEYTLAEVVSENLWNEGVDGSYFIEDEDDGATAETIFVPDYNFCHLRHSDDGEYGISPLSKDRLRTTMIVDYIKNVTDEISNDGNDYMMYLKARGTAGASLTSMISQGSADLSVKAAQDPKLTKTASDMQMEMARKLAMKLKRTAKTRFGIVSLDWVDRIEKLEGTVQLNNYLSIINDAKGTVADIYGIPAMLAGSSGGGWSTGMSALIDFTLNRTIKPFQQRYAEQLNKMLEKCAGIKGPVHFLEIEWTDKQFEAELAKLEAETLKLRAEAKAAGQPTTTGETKKDDPTKVAADVEKTKADTEKTKAETDKIRKETGLLNSQGVNGANKTATQSSTTTKAKKKTTSKAKK